MLKKLLFILTPILLSAMPNNPSNLLLIPVATSVTITWEDNSADETGFKIFKDGNIVATVGADVTSYHDSGLNPYETYRYTVKATEDDLVDNHRAKLLSPLNRHTEHAPSFSWKRVDRATRYTIMVRPLLENAIDPDWERIIYTADTMSEVEANCDDVTEICTHSPDINISGNHVWWILAGDDGGVEEWSERGYFSVGGYTDEFALDDGTDGITKGYGAWGNYKVTREAPVDFLNAEGNVTGLTTIYRPDMTVSQRPVVFFISGWGRLANTYDKFLKFVASHGYFVGHIYTDIPADINQSYHDNLSMIEQVVANNADWIDLEKVGLMGHSYGAGATVWLGKRMFSGDKNWGDQGRFIFMSTPWYSNLITKEELEDYPVNTKLLVQVSHDEVGHAGHPYLTDPRAIRAMYELISVANEEKDFITVFSDTQQNNDYNATHFVSYTGIESGGVYEPYDLLDVLLLNRLSHAMLNYVFAGDADAKQVALGNGSIEQKMMSNTQVSLRDLKVTDTPIVYRLEDDYTYTCRDGWHGHEYWWLYEYCYDEDKNGVIDVLE